MITKSIAITFILFVLVSTSHFIHAAEETKFGIIQPITLTTNHGKASFALFSPNSKYLATIEDKTNQPPPIDQTTCLWDTHTWTQQWTIPGKMHYWSYFINFSPDSKYLIVATGDKKAVIVHTQTGSVLHELEIPELIASFVHIRFNANGKSIYTTSLEKKQADYYGDAIHLCERIWNTETGKSTITNDKIDECWEINPDTDYLAHRAQNHMTFPTAPYSAISPDQTLKADIFCTKNFFEQLAHRGPNPWILQISDTKTGIPLHTVTITSFRIYPPAQFSPNGRFIAAADNVHNFYILHDTRVKAEPKEIALALIKAQYHTSGEPSPASMLDTNLIRYITELATPHYFGPLGPEDIVQQLRPDLGIRICENTLKKFFSFFTRK